MFLVNPSGLFKHTAKADGSVTLLSTWTVDPLCIDCWLSPHWLLDVDPLYIDCQSSLHQLLTLSTWTVDPLCIDCWLLTLKSKALKGSNLGKLPPPPRINSVDHLCVDCWSTTGWHCWLPPPPRINSVNHICVDCWSTPGWHCWLLIPPGSTVSITSVLVVDLPQVNTVDCWSAPPRINSVNTVNLISPSPRINSVDCLCVDCWSAPGQHCRLLTPPQDQQCWSPLCWLLICPGSTLSIDPPSYRFQLCNL